MSVMDYAVPDGVNNMTQDMFNWMSRSVNKDFVQLGYPTILTKKGSRDFVSLCSLMQNCSALLALVKNKAAAEQHQKTQETPGVSATTSTTPGAGDPSAATSATSKAGKASNSTKKRGGGLFSSSKSFKQMQQQNAETHARLTADVAKAMKFDEEYTSVYEGIAETVRRDTEEVIQSTRCLPEPEANDKPHDQQLIMFFTTRWVQFKEVMTRRMLEAGQLAVEVQSLRSAGRGWGGSGQRSKSASGDTMGMMQQQQMLADCGSDCDSSRHQQMLGRQRRRSLSRHRLGSGSGCWHEPQVSVTKVPALQAEIRRLKLDMTRREQRHKEELDRQAKERDRMARDFRHAQRRIPGPRWPAANGQQQQQQQQQQQHGTESSDQILSDVCQVLDRLADSVGHNQHNHTQQQQHHQRSLTSPPVGNRKLQQQNQQQNIQEYVDSVCTAALTRIHGLQADCHTSRRRQADLEVLISILKARLDFTNDQLSDVGKFEAAINDIARRLPVGEETPGGLSLQSQQLQQSQRGDDHRDSLVSRLTSRLRERQRVP